MCDLVSVVIRTVNRSSLEYAIKSVVSQSYRPIEVLVIHDVASFDTKRFVNKTIDGVKIQHLYNSNKHGRSEAANMGLAAAKGTYVQFLDDDDFLFPEHIEKLVTALKTTGFDIAYSGIEGQTPSGKTVKVFDQAWNPSQLCLMNFLPIHAVLFCREAADGCQFDTKLKTFEDWDFWLQLSQKSEFLHCPGVTGVYVLGSGDSGLAGDRIMSDIYVGHAAVHQKWLSIWSQSTYSKALFQLEGDVDSLRASQQRLQNEKVVLVQQHEQLQSEHLSLLQQYNDLEALQKQAHQSLQTTQQLLESVLHSKSWRITAPLRYAVSKIKAIGRLIFKVYRYSFQSLRAIFKNPRLIKAFLNEVRLSGIRGALQRVKHSLQRRALTFTSNENLDDFSQVCEIVTSTNTTEPKLWRTLGNGRPYDIVIPIYNGLEYLPSLFSSVVKNTTLPYRLIVVDDGSPDPGVQVFLQEFEAKYADQVSMILLRNEENLGFIGSVNRAVALTENHFVLLNTDVEVPPGWLERLMYPIEAVPEVASTTPMTNAGTICSFPEWLVDNEIYRGLSCNDVDKGFSRINFEKTSIEIPTGVGFCMGINRRAFEAVGMFDPVFGKGYGEENDWCMRAASAGFKHRLVTHLFVYHKHGGSFDSEEKQRLIRQNLAILRQRYPSYFEKVDALIAENPLAEFRTWMSVYVPFYLSQDSCMVIDHQLGGGTMVYRNERIAHLNGEGRPVILIGYDAIQDDFEVSFWLDGEHLHSWRATSEYVIMQVVRVLPVSHILLNALVSFKNLPACIETVLEAVSHSHAHFEVAVHDYFMLCPSYTLLNDEGEFCNLPDVSVCHSCLQRHQGEFRKFENERDIEHWRHLWHSVLKVANEVVCFSEASAQLVKRVYPDLTEHLVVRPHQVNWVRPIKLPEHQNLPIRIGVLGNINESKGIKILEKMAHLIEERELPFELVVLGNLQYPIHSGALVCHGSYEREALPELVEQYQVEGCVIPSIWPETFSYTASEVMMMGLPLFVFDLGAPTERTANYELGTVVKPVSAESMLTALEFHFLRQVQR